MQKKIDKCKYSALKHHLALRLSSLKFTGNSANCPESENKADWTYCNEYSQVCQQGVRIKF